MVTLKKLACNLEFLASKYANKDEEAKKLLDSLSDILSRAQGGLPISQDEKIPGFYWFSEGNLSKYRELENAYSEFCIFIAAGNNEQYEKILKAVDRIINSEKK